ncbi:hypothetical protein CR513_46802, partial [Mucuna pruriens]
MDAVAVVKFPITSSWHWTGINSNITKRLAIRFPPSRTKCNLHSDNMEMQRHSIKMNLLNKSWDRNRILTMASKTGSESWPNSLSPKETVDQYYKCINEKDLRQLDQCIAEDAYFDDYAFTKPFQGKKEVMSFLEQLTNCLGRNVKFRVRHISEGEDLTAAASWHMGHIPFLDLLTFSMERETNPIHQRLHLLQVIKRWKESDHLVRSKTIKFSTVFYYVKHMLTTNKTIFRRAEVLIESPIKPGSIVLTLLKNVTSVFDDFPNLTECKPSFLDFTFPFNHPKISINIHVCVPAGFLRSPHAILTWISKIYDIFVAPWFCPLIDGYIKLWAFFVRLLNSVITVVIFISKIFFK